MFTLKKPQENKPQRNPAITRGALHLQLQSFGNSILKYEFSLNAYIIPSYFHLFDLDCENRPNIQLILTAANIHVYQYPLPHHHLLGGELLLSEQCFKRTSLSSAPRSSQAGWS